MHEKYRQWIDDHIKTQQDAYGKCEKVTQEMREVFPELVQKYGQYHCYVWGPRWHWWLVTQEGDIIDPTARQFPSIGYGRYEEKQPHELPYGRCRNCGEEYYTDFSYDFCSQQCADETITFLNTSKHQPF